MEFTDNSYPMDSGLSTGECTWMTVLPKNWLSLIEISKKVIHLLGISVHNQGLMWKKSDRGVFHGKGFIVECPFHSYIIACIQCEWYQCLEWPCFDQNVWFFTFVIDNSGLYLLQKLKTRLLFVWTSSMLKITKYTQCDSLYS